MLLTLAERRAGLRDLEDDLAADSSTAWSSAPPEAIESALSLSFSLSLSFLSFLSLSLSLSFFSFFASLAASFSFALDSLSNWNLVDMRTFAEDAEELEAIESAGTAAAASPEGSSFLPSCSFGPGVGVFLFTDDADADDIEPILSGVAGVDTLGELKARPKRALFVGETSLGEVPFTTATESVADDIADRLGSFFRPEWEESLSVLEPFRSLTLLTFSELISNQPQRSNIAE